MTEVRDYNGQGRWSRESIERRFESYAKTFGTTIDELKPIIHEEGSVRWIYPVLERVIAGIKQCDPACVELGVELLEDTDSMPFGMVLKSNAARALRQCSEKLTDDQRRWIRKRVGDMLIAGYMPREFVQYVKLARAIDFGQEIFRVESNADLSNGWVRHYLERLQIK